MAPNRNHVSMEDWECVYVRGGKLAEKCEPFLRFGDFLLGLVGCTPVDQIPRVEVILSKVTLDAQ
jgi:hypothetical protein